MAFASTTPVQPGRAGMVRAAHRFAHESPQEDLLERLSSGDMEAAERVFVAFEPYLRLAVRRHLSAPFRAKFDSADIVQSTWADLLRGFRESGWRFADVDHL